MKIFKRMLAGFLVSPIIAVMIYGMYDDFGSWWTVAGVVGVMAVLLAMIIAAGFLVISSDDD